MKENTCVESSKFWKNKKKDTRMKWKNSPSTGLQFCKTFLAMLLCITNSQSSAQDFYPGGLRVNGTVRAIESDETYTYIGGNFTSVQYNVRYGLQSTTTSPLPDRRFPEVNAPVMASAPDGAGGWYIGGYFSTVGGIQRNYLAHLLADGTVDPVWNPSADGLVSHILVDGNDIYVGGSFNSVGGAPRDYVAKLNSTDGAADLSWNADPDDAVFELAVSGGQLYMGGYFTNIGGHQRRYVARTNLTDGAVDTNWNPAPNGPVLAIVEGGSEIYIGGYFTEVDSVGRRYIARVNSTDGAVDPVWDPSANQYVRVIGIDGADLYIGGAFDSVGGQQRNRLAKLSKSTDVADATWNPNADGEVNSLVITSSFVMAGGEFNNVGGQALSYLVKMNKTDGSPDSDWVHQLNSDVTSLSVSGANIYIGGYFYEVGGRNVNHLLRIHNSTGALDTNWNPNASSDVLDIELAGPYVYVGGYFTTVGGENRNHIARLDTIDGSADAIWNPNSSNVVHAIKADGTSVFAGGNFTNIGGASRLNLAKLNSTDGAVDAGWDAGTDGMVETLLLDGSDLYVGGYFNNIGTENIRFVAKLDAATAMVDTNWNLYPDAPVVSLGHDGTSIYLSGMFSSIDSTTRNYVAKADKATGTVDGIWDPNADSYVKSFHIDGSDVYVAGYFSVIGGGAMDYLAKIDGITGQLDTSWSTDLTAPILVLKENEAGLNIGGHYFLNGNVVLGAYAVITTDEVSWVGSTDVNGDDWNTAVNWSRGFVPTNSNNVRIPFPLSAGHPYPVISTGDTMAANGLNIEYAASITIDSGARLSVIDTVVVNGYVIGEGYLALEGSTAQVLSGNGRLSNLELNNSAGAAITSGDTIRISETYLPVSGVLNTNGGLELLSDSNGTAAILAPVSCPGTYIIGNVTVNTFVGGGYRSYRFLGHPFSNTRALTELTDDIDVTGNGGAANGFTTTGTNNPSSFWFDTPNGTNNSVNDVIGWVPFTNTNGLGSNSWEKMEAIRVMVRGSKGEGLLGQVYTPGDVTIDMRGQINQCDVVHTLATNLDTAKRGYNLISNPYPAPIDITLASIESNVGDAFYVWEPRAGAGAGAYVPGSFTLLGSYVLPANAGVFVYTLPNTLGDNNITFSESMKTRDTASNTVFKTTTGIAGDGIQLQVLSQTNSIYWDRLYILFDNQASPSVDKYDAYKFINPGLDFYTLTGSSKLSIDARPLVLNSTVPLGLRTDSISQFTIKVADYNLSGAQLYLIDKYLNQSMPLSVGAEYQFQVTSNPLSKGDNRFEIGVGTTSVGSVNSSKALSMTLSPNPVTDLLTVRFETLSEASTLVTVRNVVGQVIYQFEQKKERNGQIQIPVRELSNGVYTVTVSSSGYTSSQKFVKQ